MKDGTAKTDFNRSLEEIKKVIESDLKDFKKKRSFANILRLLNQGDLNTQVQLIYQIVEDYNTYPEEIDKIAEIMSKSVIYNQKLLAVSVITELSVRYPDYAFPKLSNIIINQGDLIGVISDALKNLWKGKEAELIQNIQTFWNLKANKDLKLAAILSLDTSSISDSEIMLEFLSNFREESFPEVRHELAIKLKELYIKEPYIVESEMRKWLKDTNNRNTAQIIILSFREISKRKDPFLLDRTCLIMENWSKNNTEAVSSTGEKILNMLKEKL